MGTGYAVGGVCIGDADTAARAYCSSISGVSSGGVASCQAPLWVADHSLQYSLVVDDVTGQSVRTVDLKILDCEPFDMHSYGPVVAAFFLALVSIVCLRMVYVRVFRGE